MQCIANTETFIVCDKKGSVKDSFLIQQFAKQDVHWEYIHNIDQAALRKDELCCQSLLRPHSWPARVLVPPVVHSSRPVLRKPPTLVGGIVLPVESADCCFLNHDRNCSLMFLLWWCFWLTETLDMILKFISDFEIWKQERWGSGMNMKHHCCKIWQSDQGYMENSIKVDHFEAYVTKDLKLQI